MQRSVLNLAGAIILLAGTGIAGVIFMNARDSVPSVQSVEEDSPLSPGDSRKYSRNVEIYSGSTGLLLDRWMQAVRELGHSKTMAIVIAAVSLAGSVGCFKAASRE